MKNIKINRVIIGILLDTFKFLYKIFTALYTYYKLRLADINGNLNCTNCTNCTNCIDCTNCINCINCTNYTNCLNCIN